MKQLRVAVIGAGHLGKFHARAYSQMEGVSLEYVVDARPERAAAVAHDFGGKPESDFTKIISEVDAVSVVTPTVTHHEVARPFLEAGISVLLEKPMTATVAEADDLIETAALNGAKLQIGHIERFNPAYLAVHPLVNKPAFIECHRLSPYSFRSTDVSVVLDLMIHDLDLVLDLAGALPSTTEGAGVPILSKGIDLANARLKFSTGCIANITASRVSPKPMRRLRVFQPDSYVSMDFLEKKVYVFRKKEQFDLAKAQLAIADIPKEHLLGKLVDIRQLELPQADALQQEISSFVAAVRNDTEPEVTGEHGRRALIVAVAIEQDIQRFIAQRQK